MTDVLGWIQALDGLILALAIAGLLFVEELGVPLPFAPGDLLLAIGGIAIAGGKISALEFMAIAMIAIVSGAMAGRETFSLLGWERLLEIARLLRVQAPLERVAGVLAQRGWRAVFTARLIPGLRVYTTQVAGVTHLPRRTFLAGLMPAAMVYTAAFTGLGAAFGRPILGVIKQAEHQLLLVALPAAAAVVLFFALRGPVRRAVATVQPAAWAGSWVLQLESPGVIVIPACIGLNFTGHLLATELHLPLFLDSTGTVLSALIAGPWVGGSVGLITNLVSANSIDPIAAPYGAVSFAIGFAVGLAARQGWHRQPARWLALWAICALLSSVISTPLNFLMSDGRTGVALGDAVINDLARSVPLPVAAFVGEAAVDLPDKLLAVLGAVLIYRGLPQSAAPQHALELDLAAAFRFVFRSERWRTKLLIASLCLLFSWLVVPFLLLYGYAIEVARRGRREQPELPAWDGLRQKLIDGLLMSLVFVAWNAPPAVVAALPQPAAAIGGLVGLLVGILQPAIWSQYLSHGLRGAFDLPAVARRVRFNLGLTLVVGCLGLVLPVLGLLGLALLVIGVLPATVFAALVVAYVFGQYANMTDRLSPADIR